jgi:hypothetical protein
VLRVGLLLAAAAAISVLLIPASGSARSEAAPSNVTEPQISGNPAPGQLLTATTGTWTNDPTSFAYQWLRCPADGGAGDGSNCATIAGATSGGYVVSQDDVGFTLRVKVTAANGDGNGSATSNATAVVGASGSGAPVNTAEPQISGSAIQGQTLTGTTGTWTNNPTSFAYQWLRCPQSGGQGDGSDCSAEANGSNSTYVLASTDVNFRIRLRVTASNTSGNSSAASNPTAIVQAASTAPINTSPPVISGSAVVGQTLTAAPGKWSGSGPITYAYQWLRCDRNGATCGDVAKATTFGHVVQPSELGATLRVRVTATNGGGSTQSISAPTAVVTGGTTPTPTSGCTGGGGSVSVASLSAPSRLTIDRQQVSPTFVSPQTPQIVVRYHVVDTCGRSVAGALVYATALPYNQVKATEQMTGADGWAELRMNTLSGFPVSPKQRLLAMFVRARKPGENLLGGISTRRLFSIRVTH